MKIIKINESQRNRLFEMRSEKFTFKNLSMLRGNWEKQYDYCCKTLGDAMGFGTARCVFPFNENMVLKLAMGSRRKEGIEQNKNEYHLYDLAKSPLLAKIYGSASDFSYMVCEFVTPAELPDFEKILGIPFYSYWAQTSKKTPKKNGKGDESVGFNDYFDGSKEYLEEYNGITASDILSYIEEHYLGGEPMNEEMEEIMDDIPWFRELAELVIKTEVSDVCSVENFGMVNRDGRPMLVLLDYGMNLKLWDEYYDD